VANRIETKPAMERGGGWLGYGQWLLFVITALLAAFWLAWISLAAVDFLYPLWHDLIGIDETIAVSGPRNRHRHHFELTTKAERVRLFSAMVDGIHGQGRGLESLTYHAPTGAPIATLLTAPEVVHLRDVARLLDRLRLTGWLAVLATVALAAGFRWRRSAMPSLKALLAGVIAFVGGAGLIILLLGPVQVFYGLHTRIFPPGHSWFFYYEDSLMTMMMKAPDLFAYIAATLVVLGLAYLTVMLLLTRWWLRPT
jgi:hypothetical protein